jgi:hypothetical protein
MQTRGSHRSRRSAAARRKGALLITVSRAREGGQPAVASRAAISAWRAAGMPVHVNRRATDPHDVSGRSRCTCNSRLVDRASSHATARCWSAPPPLWIASLPAVRSLLTSRNGRKRADSPLHRLRLRHVLPGLRGSVPLRSCAVIHTRCGVHPDPFCLRRSLLLGDYRRQDGGARRNWNCYPGHGEQPRSSDVFPHLQPLMCELFRPGARGADPRPHAVPSRTVVEPPTPHLNDEAAATS